MSLLSLLSLLLLLLLITIHYYYIIWIINYSILLDCLCRNTHEMLKWDLKDVWGMFSLVRPRHPVKAWAEMPQSKSKETLCLFNFGQGWRLITFGSENVHRTRTGCQRVALPNCLNCEAFEAFVKIGFKIFRIHWWLHGSHNCHVQDFQTELFFDEASRRCLAASFYCCESTVKLWCVATCCHLKEPS